MVLADDSQTQAEGAVAERWCAARVPGVILIEVQRDVDGLPRVSLDDSEAAGGGTRLILQKGRSQEDTRLSHSEDGLLLALDRVWPRD